MHLLAENGGDTGVLMRVDCGATLRLLHFGKEDLFIRDAAEVADQAEFFQGPDGPFGRVEIGAFHSVAVVVLELVVIIVVALAEGEESHDRAIACAAARGVRLVAHAMTHGVDEKRAVLHRENAEDTGQQEAAQRADRASPEKAEEDGKTEAESYRNRNAPAVLPHDQRVAAEIVDIIHRLLWPQFEKEPADVRPEEALADVVGIVIVVDVLVVLAVVRTPIEGGIFESTGAEEKGS